MKWRRGQRSQDVIDRRGAPRRTMPTAGKVGIPALLAVVAALIFGGGLLAGDDGGGALGPLLEQLQGAPPQTQPAAPLDPSNDPDAATADFMSFVLDDVQDTWVDIFDGANLQYRRAQLVLFTGATESACGGADSRVGPHYCSLDSRVYLDLGFFEDLENRFGAAGDFAQAYVLAHEIAHHVQNQLGIMEDMRRLQQRGEDGNELSVRLELQADCLSGVWAATAYTRDLLSSGDLEEGLNAAAAVGDDRLQKQTTGRIDRESWTHGSSRQRMDWFRRGFDTGDPNECDTFS